MLKISKAPALYTVPVLMHTFDILELLFRNGASMKMDDIAAATTIARSTVYRVLRTLVYRGYVSHGLDGRYRFNVVEARKDQTSTRSAQRGVEVTAEDILSNEMALELLRQLLQPKRTTSPAPLRCSKPMLEHPTEASIM